MLETRDVYFVPLVNPTARKTTSRRLLPLVPQNMSANADGSVASTQPQLRQPLGNGRDSGDPATTPTAAPRPSPNPKPGGEDLLRDASNMKAAVSYHSSRAHPLSVELGYERSRTRPR